MFGHKSIYTNTVQIQSLQFHRYNYSSCILCNLIQEPCSKRSLLWSSSCSVFVDIVTEMLTHICRHFEDCRFWCGWIALYSTERRFSINWQLSKHMCIMHVNKYLCLTPMKTNQMCRIKGSKSMKVISQLMLLIYQSYMSCLRNNTKLKEKMNSLIFNVLHVDGDLCH